MYLCTFKRVIESEVEIPMKKSEKSIRIREFVYKLTI